MLAPAWSGAGRAPGSGLGPDATPGRAGAQQRKSAARLQAADLELSTLTGSRFRSSARRIIDRNALASITTAPSHTRLMNGFVLTSIASVSFARERSAPGSDSITRPPLFGSAVTMDTVPPLGR